MSIKNALLICVFLWLTMSTAWADSKQEKHKQEIEKLTQQVQAELCPASQDPDYEGICFVRQLMIKDNWAGIRWAQEYMEDRFFLYHKQQDKWVKVLVQAYPDWQEAQTFELKPSEQVYTEFVKALFPPEPES